jgi:hypothetical protein
VTWKGILRKEESDRNSPTTQPITPKNNHKLIAESSPEKVNESVAIHVKKIPMQLMQFTF